jgi:uncharacterized SAM-binding protein YcdF (DUF218 family)
MKKFFIIWSLILILASLSIFIYRQPILIFLGNYLIYEDPLQNADAIAVLNGGFPHRLLEAIDLYQAGHAPLIIVSRGTELIGYQYVRQLGIDVPEEPEYSKMVILKKGLPEEALIILENRIDSTEQELKQLYQFLTERKMDRVILVSSKYHTRRVMKYFNRIAGDPMICIVRPSKYDPYNPGHWWTVREQARQVWLEYQKLVHYYFLFLGSLIPPDSGRYPQPERALHETPK